LFGKAANPTLLERKIYACGIVKVCFFNKKNDKERKEEISYDASYWQENYHENI
jgi:hypothetical protein